MFGMVLYNVPTVEGDTNQSVLSTTYIMHVATGTTMDTHYPDAADLSIHTLPKKWANHDSVLMNCVNTIFYID